MHLDKHLKQQIIELLRPYDPRRIAVLGSYARGDANQNSDLDILISFNQQIGLFKLVQIELELSEKLHLEIDLVTETSINNPLIKQYIERDLIKIFG